MKLYNMCWSPTGGTQAVADLLAQQLSDDVVAVDLSLHDGDYSSYQLGSDVLCLVSVPAFGGRVPAHALSALRQMKAARTNVVLVVTYGNRHYDDALRELGSLLSSLGFHVIAGIAAVTEHSIMPEFGTGRPDDTDKQQLLAFADRIKTALRRPVMPPTTEMPGKDPFRSYNGVPLRPKARKKLCTKCGLCATRCPVAAISTVDPRFTDKDACITCMRCVAICPQRARRLPPLMLRIATRKMSQSCTEPKRNELFCKL